MSYNLDYIEMYTRLEDRAYKFLYHFKCYIYTLYEIYKQSEEYHRRLCLGVQNDKVCFSELGVLNDMGVVRLVYDIDTRRVYKYWITCEFTASALYYKADEWNVIMKSLVNNYINIDTWVINDSIAIDFKLLDIPKSEIVHFETWCYFGNSFYFDLPDITKMIGVGDKEYTIFKLTLLERLLGKPTDNRLAFLHKTIKNSKIVNYVINDEYGPDMVVILQFGSYFSHFRYTALYSANRFVQSVIHLCDILFDYGGITTVPIFIEYELGFDSLEDEFKQRLNDKVEEMRKAAFYIFFDLDSLNNFLDSVRR